MAKVPYTEVALREFNWVQHPPRLPLEVTLQE